MSGRLLLVGSGSFFARNYIEQFTGTDEVIAVGRSALTSPKIHKHVGMDCAETKSLESLILDEAPDRILNFVGSTGGDFETLRHLNVSVPESILAAADRLGNAKPVRVILLGSAAEFGDATHFPIDERTPVAPRTDYGKTKVMQSEMAQEFAANKRGDVTVTVAKIFNLLGPGLSPQLAFGSFVRQLAGMSERGTLSVGNLEGQRDFLHIADAAAALDLLLNAGDPEPVYVIASGVPKRIGDLLNYLIGITGKEVQVRTDPAKFQPVDVPSSWGDSAKLRTQLGWTSSRTAERALADMWQAEMASRNPTNG